MSRLPPRPRDQRTTQFPLEHRPPEADEEEGEQGPRESGPPAPTAVRTAGDPVLAHRMGEALAVSGHVDRATHGFHTYPAGMHPDCAAAVISACPGGVHDPFCGGGTVLLEAILAGRSTSGTDLSPIALLVAATRTADPALATPMRAAARKLAEQARIPSDAPVPEACQGWYEPHVAAELARIAAGIRAIPGGERRLLEAVFSAVAIKASWRESDTANRKVPHHRAPGTTAFLFHKKARELGRRLETLPPHAPARLALADARKKGPPPGTGLVLTSPPYPGVYDYVPMQQLRLAWLGLEVGPGFHQEIGSRRAFRSLGRQQALQRWREDTAAWIACQAAGLPSGGRFAIVVGDGLVGDRMVDALGPTVEALRAAGLQVIARASADRPDHARGTERIEHLVLAERPSA